MGACTMCVESVERSEVLPSDGGRESNKVSSPQFNLSHIFELRSLRVDTLMYDPPGLDVACAAPPLSCPQPTNVDAKLRVRDLTVEGSPSRSNTTQSPHLIPLAPASSPEIRRLSATTPTNVDAKLRSATWR